MGKQKRAGRVRPVVYETMPEPFTGLQAWLKQQPNGGFLLEALMCLGEIYVALMDGFGVPVQDCRDIVALADVLYDLALAHGFTEAAEMVDDARGFIRAALEEVDHVVEQRG